MVALITAMGLLSVICAPPLRAADGTLAIVQAGVQDTEDAPFVGKEYEFLPGETVYVTFLVAGFGIQSQDDGAIRRISMTYEVKPMDANGVALSAPEAEKIKVDLNAEDKNWLPKRRMSFVIPALVAAGDFRVHVEIKDLIGKSAASRDLPFRVGGVHVKTASELTVENFRFMRREDDRDPLELAAYSAGDAVYIHFELAGFQYGPQNRYHVTYGLTVLAPDGKTFVQEPKAADLEADTYYPAQFLPGNLNVTTPREAVHGEYTILLSVQDIVANRTIESRQTFRVE